MKVLIWKAKHDDVVFLAGTEEQELAAYLTIFQIMEENGDYECCPPENARHKTLYKKAKSGDATAARQLLRERKDYEYESVYEHEATDPLVKETI